MEEVVGDNTATEGEVAFDMDDPFAMMGGMGAEEMYKVTVMQEAADWFKDIFGFAEANVYQETQQQFKYDATTGVLRSKAMPGREFKAGEFATPSLDELRKRVNLDVAREALGNRKLRLEEVIGDVSEMHAMEPNNGAVFQAASQFNALEHGSSAGKPEDGIHCYARDHTQGPACATSCAAGTVVRNYFAFGPSEGQTADRQVQNLKDVERVLENGTHQYFEVVAGYTAGKTSHESLMSLKSRLLGNLELQEEIRKHLRIGLQTDTEVVATKYGTIKYEGPQQLVTQVYSSAVSVNSCSRAYPSDWDPFARLILEATYECVLYIAVENFMKNHDKPGSRKVFLTSVGGGAFGNDDGWIKDAMAKAFAKFADLGLDIYLVSQASSTSIFLQLVGCGGMACQPCIGEGDEEVDKDT